MHKTKRKPLVSPISNFVKAQGHIFLSSNRAHEFLGPALNFTLRRQS
ncbi:hypothetical protein HanXRQr2_Chr07g0298581 [Helianthus annuus]|uniref:Uncharacterized protein n=1 Tax=Helianthus annuus TaxID=4232 RepID=A0A9K3ILZ7_HELAN|nr:hypothetical protein HanXRQr2_Chr07g0298581 [Helianthus annuus]KAJ0905014.1 hypothetical protein HanPSC8_Chr07g0289071 [Helianthus annuus]